MTFVIACLVAITLAGLVMILMSVEGQSHDPVKRAMARTRGKHAWRGAASRIDDGRFRY